MNKSAKTPRAPGRPAAAATVQREQLLSIATDLFAQQGIQATRLRAIAERAGVTPALLNYYFGNKERLVEAMVEERFLPLVARAAAQLQQAGDDPLALVEAFIRDLVRNVTEQPRQALLHHHARQRLGHDEGWHQRPLRLVEGEAEGAPQRQAAAEQGLAGELQRREAGGQEGRQGIAHGSATDGGIGNQGSRPRPEQLNHQS